MNIVYIETLGIVEMDIVTVKNAIVSNLTLTHLPRNNKRRLKEFCHMKQGGKTNMNTEMKPKDVMRALECCCINQDCYGCPMFSEEPIADCNYYVMSCALALLREKDTEIERLNKEVDRLSQVILYNDGMMVDTIKEFAERACDELRTGNIIMDKSIQDILYNLANKMKEELK